MTPEGSMTKPEPSEETLRGVLCSPRRCLLRNSSKNWRKGEPGGRSGMGTASLSLALVVVAMLTTAGDRRAARSATDCGPAAAAGSAWMAASQKASKSTESTMAEGRMRLSL